MSNFCPKCKIELAVGEAIKPNEECWVRCISPQPYINSKIIELVHVNKCPICGYSEIYK
jgi:hypothetical protein